MIFRAGEVVSTKTPCFRVDINKYFNKNSIVKNSNNMSLEKQKEL